VAHVKSIDIQQASEQHFARIHRAALVLSGNPWDADDLAQETFLMFARRSERFEGRSSLYTWLYGILLNLVRRQRRSTGLHRDKLRLLWDRGRGKAPTIPAAETRLEVSEWKRSVWSFVARLPDGQREALVLRFSEHLRYEEIAVAMDCPLGTVKSRIFHGLAGLRDLLAREGATDQLSIPDHPSEDISHAV
jgi:RNA polymerase sigma-70 factor (ECF subfamily)